MLMAAAATIVIISAVAAGLESISVKKMTSRVTAMISVISGTWPKS